MREERTLTERVERLEELTGWLKSDENSACDQAVTGQRHMGEDRFESHIERAGQQPPSPTSFEEIVNRIQTGTDRICMIASKLEEIGNRVLGPIPENAEGAGGVAKISPDGTLDHTFIALNWLDQTLCRLHAAAARLERI